MPKHKAEAPDVDLRCILCPKNPKFSDVSHLLTHISSKSHLAHKFRLEIESHTQKEAKDKLDDFEFWYNTNSLDDMLGDRMAAKEDKKKKKARAVTIKQEFKAPKEQYDNTSFRAPRANMHPAPSRGSTSSNPGGQLDQSIYSTPTARSKVPNFSNQETPASSHLDPMLTTPWKPDPEDEESTKNSIEKIPDSESAKLKGIQWPGMRVFDAATPEGKRMRNQRKDGKALRDMMATSRGVEPAEISYHANGEFRGSRDIFGPLSTETSPVQPKRQTPKKRKTRKPTFSNMSTNGPRPRVTRTRKAAAPIDPRKNTAVANPYRQNIYNQPPPTLNPLAAGFSGFNGHRYMPRVDEEEEYKLTVGDLGRKKPFTIYEDEISPDRTESPLEEPCFEFHQNHGLPIYPNNSMTSARIPPSPTPVAKPMSRNTGGMNGIGGGHSSLGQPEIPNHFHARRTMSDSQVFAPQAFLNDFNPLFNHGNHGYSRSMASFGPQYMFGGHHQNSFMDNNMNLGYGSNFMGDFRQLNPMVNAGTSQLQSMTAIVDMVNGNNENDMQFNM